VQAATGHKTGHSEKVRRAKKSVGDPRKRPIDERNGSGVPVQPSLFERKEANPPLHEPIDFYRHGWSNRLISGDSLLVINFSTRKAWLVRCERSISTREMGVGIDRIFKPFVNIGRSERLGRTKT
jgi:adenine-specific DNA-methyltransferase